MRSRASAARPPAWPLELHPWDDDDDAGALSPATL
jgi:hypothetical protein